MCNSMNYSDHSKEDLLAEIERLKREKPNKWKWTIKGICSHLAWREGIFEREHPKETPETLGRPARDPKMLGGGPF